MARVAVFASGNGSNFEALVRGLAGTRHGIVLLVTDNDDCYARNRAMRLGIPARGVRYGGKPREETEREILAALAESAVDFIALAGFMRLLSPVIVDAFPSRIVNIHPSLLPKYPGKHGIRESYDSGDSELGITIHYVDYGLDSGPIILQESFRRTGKESFEEIEDKIHALEHEFYPITLVRVLDSAGGKGEEH